jgi:flavin-binding protein dodecin
MVYKYIDIVGSSKIGIDDGIKNAIEEAEKQSRIFNGQS